MRMSDPSCGLFLAVCGTSVTLAALASAQFQPCIGEQVGNSCTLFLPPSGECLADVVSSGFCPQTYRAAEGLTTQDPSFDGPGCHLVYMAPTGPNGECEPSGEYDGPGLCRTASGQACPSGPGGPG